MGCVLVGIIQYFSPFPLYRVDLFDCLSYDADHDC